VVARVGALIAVPREEVDRAWATGSDEARNWQLVQTAAMASAASEGGDDLIEAAVFPTDGSGRELSGFYVRCQPCKHEWVGE